jgi:hypothetical protein
LVCARCQRRLTECGHECRPDGRHRYSSSIEPGGRLDLVGSALVGLFVVLLVYPLIEGRDHGWPWWTYASMTLGVLLLVVFALHQRRRDRDGLDPLVTPSVFAHRGYSAFGTVIFDAVAGGDFHSGLIRARVVEVIEMVALLLISPLLPRLARELQP